MRRTPLLVVAAVAALIGPVATAEAGSPPTLSAVGVSSRHPTATFGAPGAEYGAIFLATKPDRASNGEFLRENLVLQHALTTDEIQKGTWLEADQVDPGTYYVLLQAFDYECFATPATCTEGFSAILQLTVPKPKQRFIPLVDVHRYSRYVTLRLEVRPLAGKLAYQVCWRSQQRARRCAKRLLEGISWNSPASDSVEVGLRGMARKTTFTWLVGGKTVASKTVSTVPG